MKKGAREAPKKNPRRTEDDLQIGRAPSREGFAYHVLVSDSPHLGYTVAGQQRIVTAFPGRRPVFSGYFVVFSLMRAAFPCSLLK